MGSAGQAQKHQQRGMEGSVPLRGVNPETCDLI